MSSQYTDSDPSIEADLLVLGGGMTGLTAAARAASAGARVVLVEKGAGGRRIRSVRRLRLDRGELRADAGGQPGR